MRWFRLVGVCLCLIAGSAQAEMSLKDRLAVLKSVYSAHVDAIDGNELVMKGGRRLVIDDGRRKDHQEKLKSADIEDMLAQVYPVGRCFGQLMSLNFEPGRIRSDGFFRSVYGDSAREVRSSLKPVDWFGRTIRVTTVMGAYDALVKVRDELAKDASLRKYLAPTAGVFNWRNIAGTKRLSVHSFGAAIDINIKYAHYWRWAGGKPGRVKPFRTRIPEKIIDVFERHGFIWGGKWHHYDTMHFEYRPALVAIGRKVRGVC